MECVHHATMFNVVQKDNIMKILYVNNVIKNAKIVPI